MSSKTYEEDIPVEEDAPRLDKYCALQGVNRSIFSDPQTVISVEGRKAKKSRPVTKGETIHLHWTEHSFDGLKAEPIPLDVLYEDGQILVIDKPAGMVVHPAAGNWDHTLVNALMYRYGDSFSTENDEECGDEIRPGIVHRLDKDTSGTMIVAKTSAAHQNLAAQFKEHRTKKRYIAIALGTFREREGTIHTGIVRSARDRKKFSVCPLGEGKEAVTEWNVLRQYRDFALLSVVIRTGRTHQIRVHLASIGHPVAGDPIYGRQDHAPSLMLHAFSLTIEHPESGKPMTFRSPMPGRFKRLLRPLPS